MSSANLLTYIVLVQPDENMSQTASFVTFGAADIGILARFFLRYSEPEQTDFGRWQFRKKATCQGMVSAV
jgi:hypothetical protein